MTNTVITTLILTETGRAISKVEGRRNYTIRMEMKDKRAYVGGNGAMERRHLTSEYLTYIANHGTCWANYTYKKDFMNAIKALENNGFLIYWIS